jgi:hypothetical protein
LVWFGEQERKLAKLSMTTFTYRYSSYLFYDPAIVRTFTYIQETFPHQGRGEDGENSTESSDFCEILPVTEKFTTNRY